MNVDPECLRQHYASLSDEALREIDRADLVEAAQICYDNEIQQRQLQSLGSAAHLETAQIPDGDLEHEDEPSGEGDRPVWLDDSAEVYSAYIRPGATGAPGSENARDALEAAGIPFYLDLCEDPPAEHFFPEPTHRWRLMVPGHLNLRATSVPERDIFNAEFEGVWRTHLEMLSDRELRAAHPKLVFCGLFDRIERVNKAYSDEFSRRGLTPKSS